MLKDILLYSKNCMTTSTASLNKLLAMQLVRDLSEQ